MKNDDQYTPPKVWEWNKASGGKFANINRPIAGPTHDHELPVGDHPLQLYSLATPNGVKVTVMLEELLALGHKDAEYDAWLVDIGEGEQFGSGFVQLNPNSKIPVLLDRSVEPERPVFESVEFCITSHANSASYYPMKTRLTQNACPGFSGRRAVHRSSVVGSVTFTAMHPTQWNTLSIAMRWKPSANSMYLIANWPNANIFAGMTTRLPTSPFGPGMDSWCWALCMKPPSFSVRTHTST